MSGLDGTWLVEGSIDGVALQLDEPLSFWGGFDANTGRVIDRAHPQVGAHVTGKVLVMPGSRGSSGTPGVLGDALRQGTGPSAMIITKADINLVAGVLAAKELYGTKCPILLVDDDVFVSLNDGQHVHAAPTGDAR